MPNNRATKAKVRAYAAEHNVSYTTALRHFEAALSAHVPTVREAVKIIFDGKLPDYSGVADAVEAQIVLSNLVTGLARITEFEGLDERGDVLAYESASFQPAAGSERERTGAVDLAEIYGHRLVQSFEAEALAFEAAPDDESDIDDGAFGVHSIQFKCEVTAREDYNSVVFEDVTGQDTPFLWSGPLVHEDFSSIAISFGLLIATIIRIGCEQDFCSGCHKSLYVLDGIEST